MERDARVHSEPEVWRAPRLPVAETQEARVTELRHSGYEVVTDLGHVTRLRR